MSYISSDVAGQAYLTSGIVFDLSEHAKVRAQQRGVSRDTIELVSRFADRRTRVPGGAVALSISAKAREKWVRGGLSATEIDRACRCVMIADLSTRSIITVEKSDGRRRRFRR